ncbi:MAG TPA: penicillin-binding protein activator, partial [Steroidobacteraceae bacterium]|nr:penicillin-binding protein activator [Steroidobacteraceae bacterium]
RLAMQNPPPASVGFALSAARAWLSANRADDAQRALDSITAPGDARQQFDRELLRAETATARGQYAAAWRQISAVTAPANAADASRLYQVQQDVALRAGQPIEAVRAGISRERVATTDAARMTARRDLLADLRGAIDRGLRIDPATAQEPLVRGWLEFGQIAAAAGRSPLGAEASLERWRARFPGHPAASIAAIDIIAPAARPPAGIAPAASGSIALLLPLTGPNAAPAELIRDGFLAAIGRQPEGSRPVVKVYDTGSLSVESALQTAQSEGAGFVVGPLTRPEVQQAASQRPGVLPMLLLNSLDGDGFAGAQLYQYGLAPEDEARQIARHMNSAGQRRVVVFTPAGDWGTRVEAAFSSELAQGGGKVLGKASYDLARNDLTAALTRALGVDAAHERQLRIQQITGLTLAIEVRPRGDIDAIFVASYNPLAARQINSQVRYYNAGDIPTYIVQDGFDPDDRDNRDLEGMRFVGMPWMLESTGPTADVRASTESAWSPRGKRQSRYFAFGHDAATLATALRSGRTQWPVAGLSGRLNLTPEGRIERSLEWARFHDGAAELSDPIR